MLAQKKSMTVALLALGIIGWILWSSSNRSSSTSRGPRDEVGSDRGENASPSNASTIQAPAKPALDSRSDAREDGERRSVVPSDSAGRIPAAVSANCKLTVQLWPKPDDEWVASSTLSYPGTWEFNALHPFFPVETAAGPRMSDSREVPRTGLCDWEGFPPGVPLQFQVSSLGVVLATVEFAPLAAGEHRYGDLDLTVRPKPVLVRVRGIDGKSVGRATLEFMAVGAFDQRHAETDDCGLASLSFYLPAALDLAVAADGYASTVLRRIDLSSGNLLVVLEEERVVDVELVDVDGNALVGRMNLVSSTFDDVLGSVGGEEMGPGLWRLDKLPAGEIVIDVRTDEGSYSILHDTGNARAKIVVKPGVAVWTRFDVDKSLSLDAWSVRASSLTDAAYSTRAFEWRNDGLAKAVVFVSLPPGSYRLQIEHLDISQHAWEPWGSASSVEVGTSRVTVRLGR